MITYKASLHGSLQAAYTGQCRIGYIETRAFDRWRWQLSLVMPGGGHGLGVEDDEASAKEQLEKAFQYWLAGANLEVTREPERDEPKLRPAADTGARAVRKVRRSTNGKHAVRKRNTAAKRVR